MCKCPEPKTGKIFSALRRRVQQRGSVMHFGGAPVWARRRVLQSSFRIPSP